MIAIRKILAFIAILCICFGIVNAAQVYYGYKKGQDEYNELREICTIQAKEESESPVLIERDVEEEKLFLPDGAPSWSNIDFEKLHEISTNVVAWIELPGIDASYPVMQAEDNEYYLHRDMNGDYLFAGSIFMDCYNDPEFRNMNTIIYGHNMKNGSMFADLCNYTSKKFYEEHKAIQFDTLSSFGQYEVVAVFKFDTNHEDFRYNECCTMNESAFKDFMSQVHARQLYDTGIDAEYGDQLLTLSTCEYTYNNGRLVVVAKKVS